MNKTGNDTPELVDALDAEGHPTGEQKTKKQILADGDWRMVIHVWIVNSRGELLTQRRVEKGIFDNAWDVSVGGGVAAGEPTVTTAVREVEEELGLTLSKEELQDYGIWKMPKIIPETHQDALEFSHTFLVQKDVELQDLTLQEDEVAEVKWRGFDEFERLIKADRTYPDWVPHGRNYYLGVLERIRNEGAA